MVFFSFFILEIILLFFLSKKLVKSLFLTFFSITKSHSKVTNILAIIFLPGTIIHELSHLLTAGIMMVHVGEISVLPEVKEGGVKLGSVEIGKVDPVRLSIVGVAPVLVGLAIILGITYFAQISQNLTWWQAILGLYLIFEVANTMFSSKRDLEGTIGFVVAVGLVTLLIIIAFYFWKPLLTQNFWVYLTSLNWEPVSSFFKLSSLYILVPLILDLLIILITYPITKKYR